MKTQVIGIRVAEQTKSIAQDMANKKGLSLTAMIEQLILIEHGRMTEQEAQEAAEKEKLRRIDEQQIKQLERELGGK